MACNVVMTRLAQRQLAQHVAYIRVHLKNPQAAKAVTEDARETKKALLTVAESLDYCGDPDLRALGYRSIGFRRHRYLFIYEIRDNTIIIEAVYHELQDYENTFKREALGL